jgi:uncharacterized protein (TIGR02466 family)
MMQDIFPVRLYKQNITLDESHKNNMREYLVDLFSKISIENHSLEKDGGKSTHQLHKELHEVEQFRDLTQLINQHAANYWYELGLDVSLQPKIISMWANLHQKNNWTEVHTHSTHTLVGCYYLDCPLNSGDLLFANPLEYHYHSFPFSEVNKEKILWKSAFVRENDLVLFPAFLKHKTEKSRSDKDRISINFNFNYEPAPHKTYSIGD